MVLSFKGHPRPFIYYTRLFFLSMFTHLKKAGIPSKHESQEVPAGCKVQRKYICKRFKL